MFVTPMSEQNQRLLKDTDVILASYPRSGNTWMSLMLSDIILQSQGFKTEIGTIVIPDIYNDIEIWNRNPRTKKVPFRIIKSHEFDDTKYINIIYLFRNPADALCSYYYYLFRHPSQHEKLQKQGIDDFCKLKVEEWRTHVESYIEAKDKKSDNVLFISYESMKAKTEIILRNITRDFLGLNVTSRMCHIAVEHQNFGELQRMQKIKDSRLGWAGGEYEYQNFFRKGKVNSSKDELAQSTIDFIEANAMAIYNLAMSIEKLDFQQESNQGMGMIKKDEKNEREHLVSSGKQSPLVIIKQAETLFPEYQTQLHQTQIELEQFQSQLHQTQELLEQFQDKMQQAETLLQEYQTQLHQTQTELEQSQSQLHQTQEELAQSKSEVHQMQQQLDIS